jgi:uncharacterized protein YxjI
MKYPLSLQFKILALAPQISVFDADGQLRFYVKQKAFKLKEAVSVFADQAQTQLLYTMQADRVIDWSARYRFRDAAGNEIGSVKRQGMKSLWRSRYDIMQGEEIVATIQEENPWVKVIDRLVGEIPIIGMLTGYMLHPAYAVHRTSDGAVIMRAVKEPAFLQGKFRVEEKVNVPEEDEVRVILSLFMMLLLERLRG